jgi:Cu-Zn family superoxide dismutase
MSVRVAIHPLTAGGVGPRIGFVTLEDTSAGLKLTPELRGLTRFGLAPGPHGFHVHEVGNLMPTRKPDGEIVRGGAAGPHYDPERTGTHAGPYGEGHRGDLPAITVDRLGDAFDPVIAPRLTLREVMGRALVIHRGGDNYTDTPPNGGGEARVLGGIVTNRCPYCEDKTTMNPLIALGLGLAALGWISSSARGSAAKTPCPEPTRDLALNTRNRQLAIDKYEYGPPNPQQPSLAFWKRLARRWRRKPTPQAIKEIKSMRCGNCVAFDISPRMEQCMPGPVSKAGKLGYCWMHDFKCASLRTCATWAGGGPITEDRVSLDWQRRKKSGS